VLAEQPCFAELVPEQNQVFTEYSHRLRNVMKFLHRTDDNPIAPEPFAARRAGPHVRNIRKSNLPVLSLCLHFRHLKFSRSASNFLLNGVND
jgi:hypothetical protein